jgi:hypothetical protein
MPPPEDSNEIGSTLLRRILVEFIFALATSFGVSAEVSYDGSAGFQRPFIVAGQERGVVYRLRNSIDARAGENQMSSPFQSYDLPLI